jgi:hypothetical protein
MGNWNDDVRSAEAKAKAWVAGLSGAAGLAIGFVAGFMVHVIF